MTSTIQPIGTDNQVAIVTNILWAIYEPMTDLHTVRTNWLSCCEQHQSHAEAADILARIIVRQMYGDQSIDPSHLPELTRVAVVVGLETAAGTYDSDDDMIDHAKAVMRLSC